MDKTRQEEIEQEEKIRVEARIKAESEIKEQESLKKTTEGAKGCFYVVLIVIVLAIIIPIVFSGDGNKSSCREGLELHWTYEEIIRKHLKSPSTAKFGGYSLSRAVAERSEEDKSCIYSYSSYVDSQNSFGGIVRAEFMYETKVFDNGKHEIKKLIFDGNVLFDDSTE